MLRVEGKNIYIPYEDKGSVTFTFYGDSVSAGDVVKLYISDRLMNESILTKTAVVNAQKKILIAFTGEDTSIQPFKYKYSLRVQRNAGKDTPIREGLFVVEGVVVDD